MSFTEKGKSQSERKPGIAVSTLKAGHRTDEPTGRGAVARQTPYPGCHPLADGLADERKSFGAVMRVASAGTVCEPAEIHKL